MGYWKVRFFALVVIAAAGGMVYMNWQQLAHERSYSLMMTTFGPVVAVFGIFLLFFPQKIGRPETTGDKLLNLLVFAVGLAAGLFNWYLMDPHYFDDILALFS